MCIDPPATSSAPEPTEPSTVTSPSGKKIDCPERIGLSSRSVAAPRRASRIGDSAASTSVFAPRLERSNGGRSALVWAGSTFSMPITRTPRCSNSVIRCSIADLLSVTADKSRTTGGPTKKLPASLILRSMSAIHSIIGGWGARTTAVYDRQMKRVDCRGGTTDVTATLCFPRLLKRHKSKLRRVASAAAICVTPSVAVHLHPGARAGQHDSRLDQKNFWDMRGLYRPCLGCSSHFMMFL